MPIFLEEVGTRAQETFDKFMMMIETYDNTSKDSFPEHEWNQLDRLSCEVVTLMTCNKFQTSFGRKLNILIII